MSTMNQDLQATYQVLSLLEKSKAYSDGILDALPGIFTVIDDEGVILRGNIELGTIYSIDYEELLHRHFSDLFEVETWKIFLSKLNKMIESQERFIEFELATKRKTDTEERPFFWHISRFKVTNRESPKLFSVIGKDISELRRTEKQLSEIFASIPLGILSVAAGAKVETKYSSYAEILLQTNQIAGLTLKQLLFERCWEEISEAERRCVDQLAEAIGQDELLFDVIKSGLPKQIRYPISGNEEIKERYLGLVYQPVAYSGKITKMLVVIEDRTALVLAKMKEQQAGMLNEKVVARVIQIKQCDREVLSLLMEEIESLFGRLEPLIKAKNRRDLANTLHGIKGNARIAGFNYLKDSVHVLENKVQGVDKTQAELDWNVVTTEIASIREEWAELTSLYNALISSKKPAAAPTATPQPTGSAETIQTVKKLFERYNELLAQGESSETFLISERISLALQSFNYEPLSDLEQLIQMRVSETARQLDKKVSVVFQSSESKVDQRNKMAFSEILLHLLSNALAHGIESPQERKAKGKPEVGSISVIAQEHMGMIECTVRDDGAGINSEKVKNTALKHKLLTLEESLSLSREEIMQFIFKPGFSTTTEVNDISGRGVGLDAVVSKLAEFNGAIEVQSDEGSGTRFTFHMRSIGEVAVQRTLTGLTEFMKSLRGHIEAMVQQENFQIEFTSNGADVATERGILFGDPRRLLLAVTTVLGNHCAKSRSIVDIGVGENAMIHCTASRPNSFQTFQPPAARPEFEFPMPICEAYIKQHEGSISLTDEALSIDFGHVIKRDKMPHISLGLADGITPAAARKTIDRTLEVAKELDVPIKTMWEEPSAESKPHIDLIICNFSNMLQQPAVGLASTYDVIRKELLRAVKTAMTGEN